MNFRFRHCLAVTQDSKVTTLVGLGHVLSVDGAEAAGIAWFGGRPGGFTGSQFRIIQQ